MTKKRFKVNPMADGRGNIWYGLFDNNELEYICDAWNGAERCCRLLNELHEERNYFERKKCEYFNKWNNAHLDNINLRKENEQLKQSNQEVIELIHDGIVEMHDGKRDYAESILNKALELIKWE